VPEYDSDSNTVPGYNSDSNPLSGFYLDSSNEFDFGSYPDEPESENNTIEQTLSGPASGLVITSTPAGRFVERRRRLRESLPIRNLAEALDQVESRVHTTPEQCLMSITMIARHA
jgi:hypothetical protein